MITQAAPAPAPVPVRVTAERRRLLRRNLASINADGFLFSLMVGLGETYLPAFVLARGMGALTAAMIATIPILMGSLLQLAAPLVLQQVQSYRRFVVGTAVLQATSMLILMVMALMPEVPAWAVFLPATLYWAAGLAIGPAWNTWVEQIVPREIRSGFFARRSRLSHVGVLLGLISGGLLLKWSDAAGVPVTIFALLFGTGAAGRFVSAVMLSRQSDAADPSGLRRQSSSPVRPGDRFQAMVRTLKNPGPVGRFVLFLMAVQTAVYVSGPYFNPFMLKTLEMSWGQYMGLLSLGFVGKMISLPWAGRLANRAGADRLLWIGSLGIVPVSALWMVNQSIWFLAIVQIISGLVWGCYELAMLLQFFRQVPAHHRVGILTLYNLGNSASMVLGMLIGAMILRAFGGDREAYLAVFVASSLFRAAALLLLPGGRYVAVSTRTVVHGWISRTIAVRPNSGSIERPIFSAMQEYTPADTLLSSSRDEESGRPGLPAVATLPTLPTLPTPITISRPDPAGSRAVRSPTPARWIWPRRKRTSAERSVDERTADRV